MSDARLGLRAGIATAWANAWLAGRASLDDAAEHAARVVPAEAGVRGLPGQEGSAGWTVALGRLRAAGVVRFQLALPVPGDPLGVVGPPGLVGEVVDRGLALVGARTDDALVIVPPAPDHSSWTVHGVDRVPVLDAPADARRALLHALDTASTGLEELDVARPDPSATAMLADLDRCLRRIELPPGMSGRDAQTITTAVRTGTALAMARRGPGGAASSTAVRRREADLRPVDHAVRRALVSVFSLSVHP